MRLLVWLGLLLFVMAGGAAAQSRLDEIVARGTLRAGMTGDYAPFALKGADGDYTGLDVDMAKDLAAALQVKLEIVPTTWAKLLPDLLDGKYDIGMGGVSVNLARQKLAFFSAPMMRDGKVAIARCADRDRFTTLSAIDRPDVKVLVNPGGTNEKFDREHLHQAAIVVIPDNTRVFPALSEGEGDLMITDGVETRLQQKLHPDLCAIHPDQPFDFSEKAYLLPRDIALKQFVDQWLHITVETGAWAQLRDAYLGP